MPSSPVENSIARSTSESSVGFVLVTGIVMSLGWGLRGYIGGGPHGAMIPGVLVSLLLCHFLRYSITASATVVAFGTIGIGFGGNMTYGQTLGLIRESDTFLLGLAGTSVKGAVWGLLGGAMLGLGFVARHIAWRHLLLALAVLLLGIILGLQYVNVPQLIYFSDPGKPRDESWAGLMLGALMLLTYMQLAQPKPARTLWKCALYGMIGGQIGFGIGSLFLTLQAGLPEAWAWLPCWKFMEFFFGFVFGVSLGMFAADQREQLTPWGITNASTAASDPRPAANWWEMIPAAIVVFCVYYVWRYCALLLVPELYEVGRAGLKWTTADVLIDFTGLGCVLLILSRRWQTIAWQVAVTVTIVATAIDWQRDLGPRGHIEWALQYRVSFVLAVAAISIASVQFWQLRRSPQLMSLFLFAVCVLMGVGYMMGLAHADLWIAQPEAEAEFGGRAGYLWHEYRGEVIVHSIFTSLFIVSVWYAVRERSRQPLIQQPAAAGEPE